MHEQSALFEIAPIGTEPPISERTISPGCLLPLQSKQTIDIARTSAILGVDEGRTRKLLKRGKITGYQLHRSQRWYISYNSIVDFCDSLRLTYGICDRRPKLAAGRRWRDAELLPFPIADTVTIREVMAGLDVTKHLALNLAEEGVFECYRIVEGSSWRVSKTSLFAYAERLKAQVTPDRSLSEVVIRRNR